MKKFIYTDNYKNRIDSYLSNNFSYSRNFFHHIIQRWGILVNDKKTKKSYKLKQWDIIKIDNLERYLDSSFLEELPFVDIPIVFEKDDYLVINKPKWVLSHPNSIWDLSAPSVVAFLYQKYKTLPSIWNFIRAWLVHRLDKDTSWFMIVAKTEKWLKYFKELFNKKSLLIDDILSEFSWKNIDYEKLEKLESSVWLKKFYKAVVNVSSKWKDFLSSIKEYPYYICEIVKPKVPYPWEFKMWITKIIEKKKENNNLILKLQIITGRTHQIRYHLSNKGLFIVWDKLYWYKEDIPMQLVAYKLEFIDLDWENINLSL